MNLERRKIIVNLVCSQCLDCPETSLHALWECGALPQIWDHDFGWVKLGFPHLHSLLDLVSVVDSKSSKLELYATMAWIVWSRHNKAKCNERCLLLGKVLDSACSYLLVFQSSLRGQDCQPNLVKVKWKPPATSIVNVNFNSAMFAESNDVGIGVVICNYKGEVMAALSEKIAHLSSVDILEMLAARRVAQFIVELGFPQAVFKGDFAGIIKAFVDGYCNILTQFL